MFYACNEMTAQSFCTLVFLHSPSWEIVLAVRHRASGVESAFVSGMHKIVKQLWDKMKTDPLQSHQHQLPGLDSID